MDTWSCNVSQVSTSTINAFFPPLPYRMDACVIDSHLCKRVAFLHALSPPFIASSSLSCPSFPISSSISLGFTMEPLDYDEQQLQRPDSVPNTELTSTSSSSTLSSALSSEDLRRSTSSGDITTVSNSSGEIPVVIESEAVVTVQFLRPFPSIDIDGEAPEEPIVTRTARTKCVGRNSKGVSWGFTSVIGRRSEMEDAVAVIPQFLSRTCDHVGGCTASGSKSSGEISPVHFFGVYDGHGGSQVAEFCAKRMHEVIAEEWDRVISDGSEWKRRWEAVFASGFERTDNEILTQAVAPEMVGSTAAVVVLSRCQIITSNCGDSRAVLCRGTQTIPLTVDQKPDRPDELLRIEGAGGKVISWNGARVCGVLGMSRAIGDGYLRPWIIPVPEVTFTTRSEEDECLILASDGLWDVMTNEEVGGVARHILRRLRRMDEVSIAQVAADRLKDIAFGRYSKDNISIVVVDLKSKRKRQQRPPLTS